MDGTENAHNEKWLQKLIHRHPTCIPMDQIEPGLSTLVPVCMELPLSCGFLDNLLMTPDGDIVIIEAKLWRNPEARREVVAQALDYASSLFGMDYDSLEKAVLKADFDNKEKPARLYDIFSDADTLDEPAFVDAVTTNLKNGRIVVLVAGDGIRTSIETLIDGLQLHAGFHFTFALVELAVFRGMDDDDFLVVPRTLAKTCMIERGIVRIDNGQVEIVPVQGKPEVASSSRLQSISSEQFYEAMKERASGLPESLKAFVDKLSALGVYPEFQRSLNLKWDPPSGKPINLGYIKRTGQLWTDAASWSLSDKKLARSYIEDLAEIFGGEIMYIGKDKIPYVAVEGHAPRIETLVDKLDVWHGAIEKLQDHVRQNISTEG
ncbi:MAG: hypothetical protein COA65_00625 [Rhodospirillaceae bacterium]|nr:MAG: hypothetical protein COA65_00625 [Rhodospirillaceae bacterium]